MIRFAWIAAAGLALAGCQGPLAGLDGQHLSTAAEEPFLATNEPAALARDHFERGDFALAEQSYRRAVEGDPRDRSSWLGLAASYDELGQFTLSDRAYAKAAALPGDAFELLNNRGYSYMLRGDRTHARALFFRAQQLRPGDPVTTNNLALLADGG